MKCPMTSIEVKQLKNYFNCIVTHYKGLNTLYALINNTTHSQAKINRIKKSIKSIEDELRSFPAEFDDNTNKIIAMEKRILEVGGEPQPKNIDNISLLEKACFRTELVMKKEKIILDDMAKLREQVCRNMRDSLRSNSLLDAVLELLRNNNKTVENIEWCSTFKGYFGWDKFADKAKNIRWDSPLIMPELIIRGNDFWIGVDESCDDCRVSDDHILYFRHDIKKPDNMALEIEIEY